MAITNKLITFNKLTSFETQLAQGNILETSIVFIKDAKKIWTKGTYFDCSGGGSNNIAVYDERHSQAQHPCHAYPWHDTTQSATHHAHYCVGGAN